MAAAHTSIYSMLMTVLFYTTAWLCTLRAAAWLSTHAILPILSRIISYYYIDYYYYHHTNSGDGVRSSSSSLPMAGSPGFQASDAGAGTGTGTGTLFKLVRTAAGHILFVPVSVAGPGEESPAESFSLRTTRYAIRCFWLTLVGIVLITGYPYYIKAVMNNARQSQRSSNKLRLTGTTPPEPNSFNALTPSPRTPPPPAPTRSPTLTSSASALTTKVPLPLPDDDSDDSETPAFNNKMRNTKMRLNPAAPVFTPSLAHRRLLIDPTTTTAAASASARAFALAPASPADSPGPATPRGSLSPVDGTFTFAIAAHAARRHGIEGGTTDGSPLLPLSLGVGKMHMVLPEDIIVSEERHAEEVFVF